MFSVLYFYKFSVQYYFRYFRWSMVLLQLKRHLNAKNTLNDHGGIRGHRNLIETECSVITCYRNFNAPKICKITFASNFIFLFWSVFPSNVHINILRGLPCRLESLRLKFANEPSIFCRWGFGWVDKAQCFRSARRFGAAGSSPDFSRGFSRHGAPRPLSWTFFQCTLLSYPGQPSYSHAFRWASDLAKFYQDWGPDLCESRWRAHSLIGVSFECPYQHPPWSPVSIGKPAPKIRQWTIYFL